MKAAEPDVMVQLIRLVVLFEDLKLEGVALTLPPEKRLDEVSIQYRQTYFVRRAFATLLELHSVFHQLNEMKTVRDRIALLGKSDRKEWKAAVQFFAREAGFIKEQRNAYGGHFQDDAARYVLSKIADSDDTQAGIEIKLSDDHTHRLVFKFAESLVNMALFVGDHSANREDYLQRSFDILTTAIRHATLATYALAEIYLMPLFGWSD